MAVWIVMVVIDDGRPMIDPLREEGTQNAGDVAAAAATDDDACQAWGFVLQFYLFCKIGV